MDGMEGFLRGSVVFYRDLDEIKGDTDQGWGWGMQLRHKRLEGGLGPCSTISNPHSHTIWCLTAVNPSPLVFRVAVWTHVAVQPNLAKEKFSITKAEMQLLIF